MGECPPLSMWLFLMAWASQAGLSIRWVKANTQVWSRIHRIVQRSKICSLFVFPPAHLAAISSPERWPHWHSTLILIGAVAVGWLLGGLHLRSQESSVVGRNSPGSCDDHCGLACREWRESLPLRPNNVYVLFVIFVPFLILVWGGWRADLHSQTAHQGENCAYSPTQ